MSRILRVILVLNLVILIPPAHAGTIMKFSSFSESKETGEFIPKRIFDLNKGEHYFEGSDFSYPIKIFVSKQKAYLYDEKGDITLAIEKDLLSQSREWVFGGYVFTPRKVSRFLGYDDVYMVYRRSVNAEVRGAPNLNLYFSETVGLIGFEVFSSDANRTHTYWLNDEYGFGCSREDCAVHLNDKILLSDQQIKCLKGKISDEFDKAQCLYSGRQLDRVLSELKKEDERRKICSEKSYKPEIYEDLCK